MHKTYLAIGMGVLTALVLAQSLAEQRIDHSPGQGDKAEHDSEPIHNESERSLASMGFFVNPGDETAAEQYYNRIESRLGVIFIDDVAPAPHSPRQLPSTGCSCTSATRTLREKG